MIDHNILTPDLVYATTSFVGFDYSLYYAWAYATLFANEKLKRTDKDWQVAMRAFPGLVEGVAMLAGEAGLARDADLLDEHMVPSPNANWLDWHQYADALFIILCNKRSLGREWTFNDEEIRRLDDYLYANELLVQCLKVAAVTDRQAVLNGLLLPPETRQEDQKTG